SGALCHTPNGQVAIRPKESGRSFVDNPKINHGQLRTASDSWYQVVKIRPDRPRPARKREGEVLEAGVAEPEGVDAGQRSLGLAQRAGHRTSEQGAHRVGQ